MLDDIAVLREAVEAYRVAAVAAGVPRPDGGERNDELPLDVLNRVFAVDHSFASWEELLEDIDAVRAALRT